jgi:hypothetical protein
MGRNSEWGMLKKAQATGFEVLITMDGSMDEFLILRIPKSGGFERVVISTSGIMTALHVDGSIGQILWGEQGGGVLDAVQPGERTETDPPNALRR